MNDALIGAFPVAKSVKCNRAFHASFDRVDQLWSRKDILVWITSSLYATGTCFELALKAHRLA